ncbi:hypothetical protein [Borreliella garinii]|uniref:hypothetical protein n=1 Tax=Borreliella garinii TaxID=29519 RepID=UPI001AEDE42B|nr:hypothetical protein [Borreliella garinii]
MLELQNNNNEIVKLDNELSDFIRAKKKEIINTQGINVLFKNSSIIDKENSIENIRTWSFLILSSLLDLFIGLLLTSIYYTRKNYIIEHVKLRSKSMIDNKITDNSRLNLGAISSSYKRLSNFSKKIITQNKGNVKSLGKELFVVLDFILKYLEDDQGTINFMEDICKKSGKTKYFVKKYQFID